MSDGIPGLPGLHAPKCPDQVYRASWKGWAHFLGNGKSAPRKPEEWVPEAERLASENGGKIPNVGWLQKNDYWGLDHAIRTHPELFAHLDQDNKQGKTPEEHVLDAERLASENGGKIPNVGWLQKNGYKGLYNAMTTHPELFAHLDQDKKFKSPEKHVQDAERLASENGGKIPNSKWLIKNDYGGLDQAMRKHPGLFEHLDQDKRFKPLEAHVRDARRLASKNGGKIPNARWLQKNGYSGLDQTMRKHPGLFEHIPRRRLRTNGRELAV